MSTESCIRVSYIIYIYIKLFFLTDSLTDSSRCRPNGLRYRVEILSCNKRGFFDIPTGRG